MTAKICTNEDGGRHEEHQDAGHGHRYLKHTNNAANNLCRIPETQSNHLLEGTFKFLDVSRQPLHNFTTPMAIKERYILQQDIAIIIIPQPGGQSLANHGKEENIG